MPWFATAPSNIALIKYMGKKDHDQNLPDNPSLSYTLNNLLSYVTLDIHEGIHDIWEPLTRDDCPEFTLSKPAQERFLRHLTRLKRHFNYHGSVVVRSNNNFPHSSGLASSASSFAALTRCASIAFSELTKTPCPDVLTQAQWSRQGSGSSCRSFFSPWALWDNDQVSAIDLPYQDLLHQVIVIDKNEKAISSSLAHQRIVTSPFYSTRSIRATEHLRQLIKALQQQNWGDAYQICWREFQDMHQLFTTSTDSFSYLSDKSQDALNRVQILWDKTGDGPIVTMDAGPNIHLLYRMDQNDLALKFNTDYLEGRYELL